MSFWIPKRKGRVDPDKHELSEPEQKILARIDGTTSMQRLTMLPGMDAESVTTMVGRLVKLGLVEGEQAGGAGPGSSQQAQAVSPERSEAQRQRIRAGAKRVSLKHRRTGASSSAEVQPALKPVLTPPPPAESPAAPLTPTAPAVEPPAAPLTPTPPPAEPPAAPLTPATPAEDPPVILLPPEPPAEEPPAAPLTPTPPAKDPPAVPVVRSAPPSTDDLPAPVFDDLPAPASDDLPAPASDDLPAAPTLSAGARAAARAREAARAPEVKTPAPKKKAPEPPQEKTAEKDSVEAKAPEGRAPVLQTTAESVSYQPLDQTGPPVEGLDFDEESMPIEHIPTYSLAEAAAELSDLAAISAPGEVPEKPEAQQAEAQQAVAKKVEAKKAEAQKAEAKQTKKPEPEPEPEPEKAAKAAAMPKKAAPKPKPKGHSLEAQGTGELDLSDPDTDSEPKPIIEPISPQPPMPAPGATTAQDAIAAAQAQMARATKKQPKEESVLVNAPAVAKAAMKAAGAAQPEGGAQPAVVQGEGVPQEGANKQSEEVEELSAEKTGSFLELFETKLKQLPKEQRAEVALMVSGDTLCAFCFDPWPDVIKAVLDNPLSTLQEARLIAQHHDKETGLDHLGQHGQLLRDAVVQRYLLRNQQSSEPLLKQVLRDRPMHNLFTLCIGDEMTEKGKRAARLSLLDKFMHSSAVEKMALIVKSEGRCLLTLEGIPIDEKLTALLCRRNYKSIPLVQNLAKHVVTPQPVIRHLWEQQLVRSTKHLQVAVLQHPNCPDEFKQ